MNISFLQNTHHEYSPNVLLDDPFASLIPPQASEAISLNNTALSSQALYPHFPSIHLALPPSPLAPTFDFTTTQLYPNSTADSFSSPTSSSQPSDYSSCVTTCSLPPCPDTAIGSTTPCTVAFSIFSILNSCRSKPIEERSLRHDVSRGFYSAAAAGGTTGNGPYSWEGCRMDNMVFVTAITRLLS
jgi:hypothetical protein